MFHSRISSSHQQHAFSTGDNLSPFHFLPLLISVSACSSIYVRQHCPSAINYRKVPFLSFTIPYCSYFLFFKDFYSFLLCHCYSVSYFVYSAILPHNSTYLEIFYKFMDSHRHYKPNLQLLSPYQSFYPFIIQSNGKQFHQSCYSKTQEQRVHRHFNMRI